MNPITPFEFVSVLSLCAATAFASGWMFCRARMQPKIDELFKKVNEGKAKLQKGIDDNK